MVMKYRYIVSSCYLQQNPAETSHSSCHLSAKMYATHIPCLSLHIMIAYTLFVLLHAHVFMAVDTISRGNSLSGNQTIISREGNFELGFFRPGNSLNYYIGIWYKKISVQTVIWVANRESPVSNTSSSDLKISEDGNLVLIQNSKFQIWSTNSSASASVSAVAVLLDNGNLILRDQLNTSAVIWQSFDHPTDTWIPQGWIGMNKITGEYQRLTSWKNKEDPAPGPFTDSIDPDGSNQFVLMWNGSEIYWRSGVWNGQYFSLLPGMSETTLYIYKFVDNAERKYFTLRLSNNYTLTRNVIDSSGKVKQYMWLDSTEQWLMIWSQPVGQCDVYSVCGPFGICDQTTTSICSCPLGFRPASMKDWELQDWSSGCVRRTNLQCGNKSMTGEKNGFLVMPNMRLPANSKSLMMVQTNEECELACLNDCSCTAYSYATGCLFWSGDVRNLQQLSDGDSEAETLYLRLASSDLPTTSKNKKTKNRNIIIGAVAGLSMFLLLCLIWIFQKRKWQGTLKSAEGPSIPFKYNELRYMTNNFSEKLGEGGFGTVFKGALSNSTVIAVKKLEGLKQGEKQFRNEVSTLSRIQHVNLVRLLGFCCERDRRLLIYEYMQNGSLDHHLFRNNSKILDWKTRYKIILGIARGLVYLHEECRECIIHCDIKPGNILLDAEFCPKVSDFGMSKLISHDFSRVLTSMRGTIGYLAPEWITGSPITVKADVYSFGMMLFEVISGSKNSTPSEDANRKFFPVFAAAKVIAGEVLDILDEKLEGDAEMEELNRACRVACWCIQDSEACRPSMGQVVQILEGVLEVRMPPMPKRLQQLAEDATPNMSSY